MCSGADTADSWDTYGCVVEQILLTAGTLMDV